MRRRAWLLAVIGLSAVLTVLVAALLQSSVQTCMVRKLIPVKEGRTVTIERVAVSPGQVLITGLKVTEGPATLTVPTIQAEVSVWGLMTHSIQLKRLVAKGWQLQWAGGQAPSATAIAETDRAPGRSPALAGWAGLLAVAGGETGESKLPVETLASWLELPVTLAVDGLDLDGFVEWREAGPGQDGQAEVSISGGNIHVGQKSRILITVAARSADQVGSGIQSLNIEAEVGLQLVEPDLVGGLWVASTLRAKRNANAEFDVFKFDFGFDASGPAPRMRFSLADATQLLFSSEIEAGVGELGLTGDWTIALTDESVSSLMLGTPLPEFMLRGKGAIRSGYEFTNLELEGAVNFEADRLEAVAPSAGALGRLTGNVVFAGKRVAEAVRMTRWQLDVNGAAPVLQARLLQGVEYSFAGLEVRVEQPADPVFMVDLLGMPLNWFQPWLSPWTLDGRPLTGAIVALATPGGLRLVTSRTLQSSGLVVAKEGTSLIDGLDLAVDIGTEITPDGWQVEIDRMEVADAQGVWADLTARGGQLINEDSLFKMAGRFQVDLAALARVPQFEGQVGLASGQIDGEFGVGLSDRVALALTAAFSNLATPTGEVLPAVQLDSRIDLLGDGSIEAHLPMQFSRAGRISDLTLNARLNPVDAGWQLAGSLSGPRAYWDDIQFLAAGLGLGAPNAGETTRSWDPSGRAAWHGLTGEFETAIGLVELAGGLTLADVRGDVAMTPTSVRLNQVRARIGEQGAVEVRGQLQFDQTREQRYSAQASIRVDQVEAGLLLRAGRMESPLPMEGEIKMDAVWESAAAELEQIWDGSALEATLTSSGGILRVLGVKFDQHLQTGRTVAALGGLLALATGDTRTQRYAERVQALTAVGEQLSTLVYDQLNVQIKRTATGEVEISEISVISPSLRILGQGRINARPDASVWHQPLSVQLQIAAREQLAVNLQTLQLLQTEADALGYLPLTRDISLDGSLARMGTAELERLLTRALTAP